MVNTVSNRGFQPDWLLRAHQGKLQLDLVANPKFNNRIHRHPTHVQFLSAHMRHPKQPRLADEHTDRQVDLIAWPAACAFRVHPQHRVRISTINRTAQMPEVQEYLYSGSRAGCVPFLCRDFRSPLP